MPPTFTQAGRPIIIDTPLGTDALLLNGFTGSEAISAPFRFRLDLLAPASAPVTFASLLGQSVTVNLTLPDGSTRPINGIIGRLTQGPRLPGAGGGVTFLRYKAELVPKFWLLTRNVQSRTFQHLSVPDILKKVLTGLEIDDQTSGTFDPRDYCVQYRESDFDFANRLMEEEGIYYYFQHSTSSHKMVLGNTPSSHADVPGPTTVQYQTVQGGVKPDDRIFNWEKSQEISPGKYTLWDFCFEMPDKNLAASSPITGSVTVGTVSHSLQVGGNSALEVYDYPGGYAQRYDGVSPGGGDQASQLQKIFQDNTRTATIRMQREALAGLIVSGEANVRHLAAGCKFTLAGHFDGNGPYVLSRVDHKAGMGGAYLQDDGGFSYGNTFECIPATLPYRPARTTLRPRIEGTQTAVVVGPSGQEIFTDKYSRVKVQFPWDREGQNDANSSCWVRVATTWAGKQWGFVQIPRIGQEVIVSFEEGDPDRPIITGSVYNAALMPPFDLPTNMTQSGTISRSSPKGESTNFNQLWLEDKKGSELVYFHAEKDFHRVVENNDALEVGSSDSQTCPEGSQTISVYKDRTTSIETGNEALTVKKGNRTVTVSEGNDKHEVTKGTRDVIVQGNDTHEVKQGNRVVTIDQGNDTHEVKMGNRVVTIDQGNDTHEVKMGNREVTIDMGNDTLTIKMGNQTTKLNLGASSTEAMQGITLKVGQNSIEINQMGITIKGMMVSIQGQVQTQVKGLICQVSGDAMLQMKGGITMIN
jgi:type VI secretion system secreted protein VgrG